MKIYILPNRLIILLSFITCIVSCNQKKEKKSIPDLRKIDTVLTDIFQNKFPNYMDNALTKDKALTLLTSKIDSLAPLHYLEEIPLKIFKIQKNPHGKGALVQFYTDNIDRPNKNIFSNQLQFDILGFMSEELASTLDEKKKYFIFGHKYKRLNKTETYIIVNTTYFSPETEISKDAMNSDVYTYKVGVFLCEIDSVRQVIKNR
jgi:hypothetical protein